MIDGCVVNYAYFRKARIILGLEYHVFHIGSVAGQRKVRFDKSGVPLHLHQIHEAKNFFVLFEKNNKPLIGTHI